VNTPGDINCEVQKEAKKKKHSDNYTARPDTKTKKQKKIRF